MVNPRYNAMNIKRSIRHQEITDQVENTENMFNLSTSVRKHLDRIQMDVVTMFDYEGLPDTIKPHHIELPLYEDGHVIIVKHKETGLPVALRCELSHRNIYGDFTRFRINQTDENGKQAYRHDGVIGVDGVLVRNNVLLRSTWDIVELYAERLANIEITADVNIFGLRTPLILEIDQDQLADANALLKAYKTFKPAILKRRKKGKNFDPKGDVGLKGLQTGITPLFNELHEYKHQMLNELYTRLGINNSNQLKKERQVVAEVHANNEQVETSQSVSIKTRQEDIERVNEMFGLSIKVEKPCGKDEEDYDLMAEDNQTINND